MIADPNIELFLKQSAVIEIYVLTTVSKKTFFYFYMYSCFKCRVHEE